MPEKIPSYNRKNANCEDFFLSRCKIPSLSDLITTVESFWQFEPPVRDTAIALHAAELKIASAYFYAIAFHIKQAETMGGGV